MRLLGLGLCSLLLSEPYCTGLCDGPVSDCSLRSQALLDVLRISGGEPRGGKICKGVTDHQMVQTPVLPAWGTWREKVTASGRVMVLEDVTMNAVCRWLSKCTSSPQTHLSLIFPLGESERLPQPICPTLISGSFHRNLVIFRCSVFPGGTAYPSGW